MKFRSFALQTLMALWAINVSATPAQVIIIRHGEKPPLLIPPQPRADQLSAQGCERAYSLPTFFNQNSIVNTYGRPVELYAQAPNDIRKTDPYDDTGSLRPLQTLIPLADLWNVSVNANYTHKDFQALVNEILTAPAYDGKTVIITWEHQAIPQLAETFGVPVGATPQKWPDYIFDEAWVIRFGNNYVEPEFGRSKRNHKKNKYVPSKSPELTAAQISLSIIPENVLPPLDNPPMATLQEDTANWENLPQLPPGTSPAISNQIQTECQNNDSLNALLLKRTNTNPLLMLDIENEVNTTVPAPR
jgi:hypothetical protein